MSSEDNPSTPIEISVELRKKIAYFLSQNHLTIGGPRDLLEFEGDLRFLKDTSSVTFQKLIAIHFLDQQQGFDLPPGRTLNIGQAAGVIQGFSMTIFDQPKPFAEAVAFLGSFIADLRRRGWRAQSTIEIPETPEQIEARGTWKIVAQLRDDHDSVVEIRIVDYGLAPKSESWIVPPLGHSSQASHSYLVQVSVDIASSDEVSSADVINPRRLFVHGDRNAKIPLKLWLDDPNWTPQAAGMVPAPPEVRAQSDHTNWVMPPAPR